MQTVEGNLRRIIDEKGIKQRHLAEKAGIPEKTLSAMLNGRREIHHDEYEESCKKYTFTT